MTVPMTDEGRSDMAFIRKLFNFMKKSGVKKFRVGEIEGEFDTIKYRASSAGMSFDKGVIMPFTLDESPKTKEEQQVEHDRSLFWSASNG